LSPTTRHRRCSRPPLSPQSSLLPYTTLSRSHVADFDHRNAAALADGATLILDATDNFETRFLINDLAVKHAIPWVYAACVGARADRKSTRLNSSHVKISYAVFCLKKKKY